MQDGRGRVKFSFRFGSSCEVSLVAQVVRFSSTRTMVCLAVSLRGMLIELSDVFLCIALLWFGMSSYSAWALVVVGGSFGVFE